MAMQYLSGSKGVYIPSGVEVELVYDTCSESQFVWVRAVTADNNEPKCGNKPTLIPMACIHFTHPITEDFQGA